MSYCDCRICRYHSRPFLMEKCPHPHFPHPDTEKWNEYLATEEGVANMAKHEANPEYRVPKSPFGGL